MAVDTKPMYIYITDMPFSVLYTSDTAIGVYVFLNNLYLMHQFSWETVNHNYPLQGWAPWHVYHNTHHICQLLVICIAITKV